MTHDAATFPIDNTQLPIANQPTALRPQPLALPSAIDCTGGGALRSYINAAVADETRRAYQGDLQDFLAWGGCIPCSADALAQYVADRASVHKPSTVRRRVVGISRAHTSAGFADPAKSDLVRAVMRGVRRLHVGQVAQVSPMLREDILQLMPLMTGVRGLRDRALLLLGFACAMRRAELVAVDAEHIEWSHQGLLVHVLRSKTDQLGVGRKIAVPYGRTIACPVSAVRDWMQIGSIDSGPLFRSIDKGGAVSSSRLTPQSVALIIKARMQEAGFDCASYSGHSLRAGLVTSAAQAGVSITKIQQQTGHASLNMLARYVRDAKAFEGNAAGALL